MVVYLYKQNIKIDVSVYRCAFVKYFKEDGEDSDTSCKKLKWESQNNLWKLADIETIIKIVHVVPNFSSNNELFFLNKLLFR